MRKYKHRTKTRWKLSKYNPKQKQLENTRVFNSMYTIIVLQYKHVSLCNVLFTSIRVSTRHSFVIQLTRYPETPENTERNNNFWHWNFYSSFLPLFSISSEHHLSHFVGCRSFVLLLLLSLCSRSLLSIVVNFGFSSVFFPSSFSYIMSVSNLRIFQ